MFGEMRVLRPFSNNICFEDRPAKESHVQSLIINCVTMSHHASPF